MGIKKVPLRFKKNPKRRRVARIPGATSSPSSSPASSATEVLITSEKPKPFAPWMTDRDLLFLRTTLKEGIVRDMVADLLELRESVRAFLAIKPEDAPGMRLCQAILKRCVP